MLRRTVPATASAVLAALLCLAGIAPANADGGKPREVTGAEYGVDTDDDSVNLHVDQTDSPTPTTTRPDSSAGKEEPCFTPVGEKIACWVDGYWWSTKFNRYCKVAHVSPDDPAWNGHRDAYGNPLGTLYDCKIRYMGDLFYMPLLWDSASPITPGKAGSDPATTVRTAIASLKLHPPTVGVGANHLSTSRA